MVQLLAGSSRRTSAKAPAWFSWHLAGRRLRWLPATLREGPDSGSCLLGACAAEVLRHPPGACFAFGSRSPGTNRCFIRDRERDSRSSAGRTKRGSANTSTASAGIATAVVRREPTQAIPQIRHSHCHSLRPESLERLDALL